DQLQAHTRKAPADLFQERPGGVQAAQRAGGADPDEFQATPCVRMLDAGGTSGIDTGWNDLHALGTGPAGGFLGEEGVACHDSIGCKGHGREAPLVSRAVHSFRRVGVAQENSIVEVEEEVTDGPAQKGELPEGQEFSLENDRVRAAEVVAEAKTCPPRAWERT